MNTMKPTTYLAYLYSVEGVHTLSCQSLSEVGLDCECTGCQTCDLDVAVIRAQLEDLILADYHTPEEDADESELH